MSTLADRIRGIVRTPGAPGASDDAPPDPANPRDLSDLSDALGGEWSQTNGRACYVVERRWAAGARHGREAIGALAERLDRASSDAALFTSGAPAAPPFVFFDLETTGLSGGAGTLAFLVGCGWFESDGSFLTRQFLMTQYADERAVLERVAAEFSRAGALVSFNGKSFDTPLLETRFVFHRLPWVGAVLPHVDVLHPARRFWKRDGGRLFAGRGSAAAYATPIPRTGFSDASSCSLQTLERQLLGLRRIGDVSGFEIPARYFQFVRSGDARPLAAIVEHNRLDLLTLAALTARLLHMVRTGPADMRDAREVLALGVVYQRSGLEERARTAFRLAIERCRSPRGAFDPLRIEALRQLALSWRRARMHEEAAACWTELLATRGCPAPIEREATAALAIHNEHRRRDFVAARAFALRGLDSTPPPAWSEAVRHRLARIERKLDAAGAQLAFVD